MENPEKISLQFELLNTYYSKIACKMSHTPLFMSTLWSLYIPRWINELPVCAQTRAKLLYIVTPNALTNTPINMAGANRLFHIHRCHFL